MEIGQLEFNPKYYTVFNNEGSEYVFLLSTYNANRVYDLSKSFNGTIPNENLIEAFRVKRKAVRPGKIVTYKKEEIEANILIDMQ